MLDWVGPSSLFLTPLYRSLFPLSPTPPLPLILSLPAMVSRSVMDVCLVGENPTCAPSPRCGEARVYGVRTTGMYGMSTPPLPVLLPSILSFSLMARSSLIFSFPPYLPPSLSLLPSLSFPFHSTVRGSIGNLPIRYLGELAAATLASGAFILPHLHILWVSVQVRGGKAQDAPGESGEREWSPRSDPPLRNESARRSFRSLV